MDASQDAGSVVVLTEPQATAELAPMLAGAVGSVSCYGSMEELIRARPVGGIDVLVLHCREQPRGDVLAALGRLSVEYPAVQKVAVLGEAPSLVVATYLTACGVDVVWSGAGEGGLERLSTVVERMREGAKWMVTR